MIEFMNFAQQHGLIMSYLTIGKLIRTPTEDHPQKRNGAYLFTGSFGWVKNWATMTEPSLWFGDGKEDKREIQKAIRKSQDDRKKRQLLAVRKAHEMLAGSRLEQHAYLDGKGFKELAHNVLRKEAEQPLRLVPMYVGNGLVGCQTITIDGDKRFIYGQRCSEAVFSLGSGRDTWLVEGFATGLSLQVCLKALRVPYRILVCFSAGNMKNMGGRIPTCTVMADNDSSNTGEKVAVESGHKWLIPPEKGMDFNDLWKEMGTFKASQWIYKQLAKNAHA